MTDLRTLRKELGISQRSLAQQLGVSQSLVSHIEAGAKSPSLRIALQIEQILGVRPEYLRLLARHELVLKRIRAPRRKPAIRAAPARPSIVSAPPL